MPRPIPLRRRIEAHLNVSADSISDLGIYLMTLGTELLTDEWVPESVDRYTVTDGAVGHIVADADPEVTAESYQAALRDWCRETLRTHVRADHRAAADLTEPF